MTPIRLEVFDQQELKRFIFGTSAYPPLNGQEKLLWTKLCRKGAPLQQVARWSLDLAAGLACREAVGKERKSYLPLVVGQLGGVNRQGIPGLICMCQPEWGDEEIRRRYLEGTRALLKEWKYVDRKAKVHSWVVVYPLWIIRNGARDGDVKGLLLAAGIARGKRLLACAPFSGKGKEASCRGWQQVGGTVLGRIWKDVPHETKELEQFL